MCGGLVESACAFRLPLRNSSRFKVFAQHFHPQRIAGDGQRRRSHQGYGNVLRRQPEALQGCNGGKILPYGLYYLIFYGIGWLGVHLMDSGVAFSVSSMLSSIGIVSRKVLVPLYLKGWNPIWVGLAITLFLTILIIALVYGFDRRCWAAVSGSFLGILVTCVLGILFTDLFQIHGAVMDNSESLLYSGYAHLNLTQIFMASIFIGASGAVMDLSVDITSAIHDGFFAALDI